MRRLVVSETVAWSRNKYVEHVTGIPQGRVPQSLRPREGTSTAEAQTTTLQPALHNASPSGTSCPGTRGWGIVNISMAPTPQKRAAANRVSRPPYAPPGGTSEPGEGEISTVPAMHRSSQPPQGPPHRTTSTQHHRIRCATYYYWRFIFHSIYFTLCR
ncbi:hypothetical protein KM043_018812 [Ampulex compressa]|nr:hypothetical protein KM043_018812 [Ampulex compressa]